ncbi:hypothetical protein Btru_019941 [Bulinus truncatus]|nr:hypothetical protein Btru_019941 [Bulinus truncatus]
MGFQKEGIIFNFLLVSQCFYATHVIFCQSDEYLYEGVCVTCPQGTENKENHHRIKNCTSKIENHEERKQKFCDKGEYWKENKCLPCPHGTDNNRNNNREPNCTSASEVEHANRHMKLSSNSACLISNRSVLIIPILLTIWYFAMDRNCLLSLKSFILGDQCNMNSTQL